MPNVVCENCGGTDFYKDAGYFFCSECQVQTQELHEQECEQPDETIVVRKTRKIRTSDSGKGSKQDVITTWEGYNYILLGLVNELIELGANPKLQPVVQTIWFNYLQKIEVLHLDQHRPPRLPAFNFKHDAKVLFGRKNRKKVYKRKRANSTASSITSESETAVSHREHSRLKRAMAATLFDTSQQLSQESESSLLNVSLGSLRSNDDTPRKESYLRFSRHAKEELLAHMSTAHLKEHIVDIEDDMACHDLSYRSVTASYLRGPKIMTQTKLYAFLCLGLLLNKDDIQLGDMLRYVAEGSLSYNHYQQFFPEELEDQTSFLNKFKPTRICTNTLLREVAGKLANYLEMEEDIPMQNIVKLIKRYATELNLPESVATVALHLLSEHQPKMKSKLPIPNYEARAMCYIIFTLKILFGLDDATELQFSRLATEANRLNLKVSFDQTLNGDAVPTMFNFDHWLRSLCYRRIVLAKYHYPTQFAAKEFNCKSYLDFINKYYHKYDIQPPNDKGMDYDVISRLVFNGAEYESKNSIDFESSLSPIRSPLDTLLKSNQLDGSFLTSLLALDCTTDSLDYLLHPRRYQDDIHFLPRGANDQLKMVPIYSTSRLPSTRQKSLIACTISKRARSHIPKMDDELDTALILAKYDHLHGFDDSSSSENNLTLDDLHNGGSQIQTQLRQNYTKHYEPEKRFCMRFGCDLVNMLTEDYEKFFSGFPYRFQLILNECAHIISQSTRELMIEYNYFEAYVCYQESKFAKGNADQKFSRLIGNAKKHW